MRFSWRAVALTVVTTLIAVPSWAQMDNGGFFNLPLDPTINSLPENMEILRLENGIDVILLQNPAQPMVGIYTQVKVGSAWEDERTSGMSHMLEHLLFNGSEKYSQEELYDAANFAGAYNNANTARFYTNFMMVIPAAEIETGMELQGQMLFHSLIPTEKFEKEKGIVIGEIVQSRDWPGHDANAILEQALFAGSSLELPTLGTKSSIENMVRDDVHAFYRKWYVPNNMVVTVAGNFDRDQAVALLNQFYGVAAPGTVDRSDLRPAALIDRTRTVTRRAGDENIVALTFEAPSYGMADFFPFLVMVQLLDLEGSGILTAALADTPAEIRPDLGVWWERASGFGRLTLQFNLPDGVDPNSIYRSIQDALIGAIEMGVTGEDILGIVRMSETETLLEREQLRMTGYYIAEPVVQGGIDFFTSYLDQLREVTAEDVTRILTNWLIDAPCLAVAIEPVAAAKPENASRENSTPLVDRTALPNGAVLVSQTVPNSPLMAIHLAVRGRALIDQEYGAAGALDIVHRLFSEGFSGCDGACLARRLRRLGAVVKLVDDGRIPMDNYYTNGRFSYVRIEVAAEHGAEVLTLLTEQLRFASFTEADFEKVRDDRLAALQRKKASARSTANEMLTEGLAAGQPMAMPAEGDIQSLTALTFSQVRQVYRQAFTPENLIFAVVGPLEHTELKNEIEMQLPGTGTPGPTVPALMATAEASELAATVGGQMAAIRLGSVLDIDTDDRAALELTVAVLSDRMGMDLREKQGLSYSVGANLSIVGPTGKFLAWINPPQERLEEGKAAIMAFVAAFDATTISQKELDKIRAARRGRLMMRRLSSMGQAYYLAMAELEGDIAGYLNGLSVYDDQELSDLQRVAEKYLTSMNMVTVVVN
ncbi:MAG: zinc protease [Candidatus Krumholzibacteriia bacterium]|jgi:zinc protease